MSASLVNEHISTKPSASSAAVKSSSINSVYVTRIMHDLCTTTRELTVLREAHIKAVQKLALYAKREEGEGEGMGNNVNGDGVGNKVGRSKGEKGEEDNYSDEYEHENEHHNDGDSNIDTSNGSNNDFHSNTNNESSEHAGEANKADDNHTENADTDSRKEESETEKRSPVITAERGDEEAASVMVNGTLNRKHLDVSTLEALSRSIVQERRRSTIAGKSALVQRLQLEIRQLKRELSKERKEREEQCEKVLAQEKDLKASRVKISKLKLDVNREKTNTRKLEKLQGEMKDGWEEYVAQAEKQIEKESKSRERQERKQKKMLMMHTKRERELTIQIRGLETEKQVLADDNGALRQREGEAEGQVEKARSELLRVQRLLDTERKERKERDTINVRVDEKKAPNAVNNAHSYCDSTAGIDAAAAADGEDDSQTEERNEYRKERDDLMIKIEALKAQLIDLLQQQQQHERREERQAKEREDRKEHTRLVDNRSDGKDSGDDDKDYEYDDEFEDDDGEGDIEAKQVYDGNDTNGNDNDCTGANTSAKSKAEGHVANADLAETKTNAYQDVQKLKQRVIEQDTIIKQLQQEREKTMKENRKEKEKKKEKRVIDTLEKETVILSKIEQLMKNLERKRKENKKLKTELDLFEQKFTTLIQINAQAQTRVATTTMTCDGGASGNIYDNSNAMGGTINGENDVRTDSSHITKSTFCKASEKSEGKEMTKMKINDAIREKEDIIQGQRWEIIREKEERLLETEEELRTQKLLLSQKNDVLKQRLTRLTQKEQELRVKADELREKNSVLDEKEQELVVKREDINMINVLLEERDTLILQKEEQLRVLRAETQAGKEASDVENGIKTETTKEERRNEDNVMVAGDTSSEEESENEYDDEDAFESEDSDSDVFRLVSVLPLSTPIQLPSSVVSVAAQEQQGRDQSRSVSVERETKDQQLEGRMTKGTQQERQQAVQEKKRSREHEKLAIKVKDIAGDTEHSRDDCNIEVEADSEERRKEMREHVSEILAMKTELANAQTALRMSQDRYGVLEYSYHEQNIVIDNQKQELLRVKFQYQDAIANRKKREV